MPVYRCATRTSLLVNGDVASMAATLASALSAQSERVPRDPQLAEKETTYTAVSG